MSSHIPAIYDSGVFRPLEPVNCPDGARAEVVLLPPTTAPTSAWPTNYFDETAGSLAGEDFERPLQGELPRRDVW